MPLCTGTLGTVASNALLCRRPALSNATNSPKAVSPGKLHASHITALPQPAVARQRDPAFERQQDSALPEPLLYPTTDNDIAQLCVAAGISLSVSERSSPQSISIPSLGHMSRRASSPRGSTRSTGRGKPAKVQVTGGQPGSASVRGANSAAASSKQAASARPKKRADPVSSYLATQVGPAAGCYLRQAALP